MPEDTLNASNPETANHHWFPFLRFKKECEAAGKEVREDQKKGAEKQRLAIEKAVAQGQLHRLHETAWQ